MKNKIILSISIILATLLSGHVTSATSGACSYHNGVNCAAGATYTGNVMCNDGWINSSAYYSDADECKTSNIKKDYDLQLLMINQKISELQIEWSKEKNYTMGYLAKIGALSTTGTASESLVRIDNKYKTQIDTLELLKSKIINNQILEKENLEKLYRDNAQATCTYSSGAGSIYKDNMCVAPLKIKTTSIPSATASTQYSAEILYSYNGKRTPILVVEDPGYDFIFNFYNFNGNNGIFNISFTGKKVGNYILNTKVMLDNVKVATQKFAVKVVNNGADISVKQQVNTMPSTSTSTAKIKIIQKLSLGSKGVQVSLLQKKLGLEDTGYFGVKTKKAVSDFQKKNNLSQIGSIGPATMEKLNSIN